MKHFLYLGLLVSIPGFATTTTPGGIPVHDVATMPAVLHATLTTAGAVLDDHRARGAGRVPCQPPKGAPVTVLDSTSETGDAKVTMALVRIEQGSCAGQLGWVHTSNLASLTAASKAK